MPSASTQPSTSLVSIDDNAWRVVLSATAFYRLELKEAFSFNGDAHTRNLMEVSLDYGQSLVDDGKYIRPNAVLGRR